MIEASKWSLWIGGVGLCLLGGAAAAHAQEAGGNAIGPAQLRDFSLTPKQTIVRQPPADEQPAPRVVPPSPVTQTPVPGAGQTARPAQPSAQTQRTPAGQTASAPAQPTVAPPSAETAGPPPAPAPSTDLAPSAPLPAPAEPASAPVPGEGEGPAYWLYGLPAALLALMGMALFYRRRRRNEELAYAAAGELAEAPAPAPVPAAPPAPRADPIPRPWLELELKTLRASFSAVEAVVEFELSISNTGGSPARNLRIDVKMFNAGREQDTEIGAFFRTAGRESTKLNLPGIRHGTTGVIHAEVAMPLEEMKAMKLDGRMLFIPVVAVNALYDWGEGRSGQTSKSYVVGRELETPSEKMGAFRVDQGPRIWRTVGQRPHSLARRV